MGLEREALLEDGCSDALIDDTPGENPIGDSPSRTRTHRTLLGTEVIDDADGWHYVMVFARASKPDDIVRNAADILQDCLTPRMLASWTQDEPSFFDKLQEGQVVWADFLDAIWKRTIDQLSGRSCGFRLGYQPSLDGSSTLLYISLSSQETVDQLADRIGMKIRVTPMSYTVKGMTCPEVAPTLEQRLGLIASKTKHAPAHIKYESHRKASFTASAAHRVTTAKDEIEQIAADWHSRGMWCKAHVRRLMRLEDVSAAALVVIVDRIIAVEQSGDQHAAGVYREIFTEMNVCLESHHVDWEHEVEVCTSDAEKMRVRWQRWTPPRYPSMQEYVSAPLYDEITHLDILRLIKRRIAQFLNVSLLEKHGIITGFFPPHHSADVQKLCAEWASLHPKNLLQWPGNQHDDMVRDYFGEEVAFFFDWLSYMTRMLIFPAVLSLLSGASLEYLREDQQCRLRNAFSVLMVAWVAHLTASYDQVTTTRNIIWGMTGYSDRAMVRSQYEPALRGSCRERAIRAVHWALVAVVITQTIWSAGVIAQFRHDKLANPEGVTQLLFGLEVSNTMASDFGVYAVTANIQLVNVLWDYVSPQISDLENWRTDQAQKNHQVTKSFLVKCVVYYYPFFYLAFVRDFVEMLDGGESLHELKVNLSVFIVTHIASVIISVVFQVASSWYQERSLRHKVSNELHMMRYSYVQAQANRPQYAGDTADYMELSIVLGFISMFSVVYPFLAFMAFVSNLIEMRVLAFRMCRVLRRPVPRGQEGVGAWLSIMKFLTYLSCVTCVALCIFVLKPLKQLDMEHKLGGFVITEHTMLALAYLIGQAIPAKSVSAELITENNDEAMERILGGDAREVEATSGSCTCLQRGTERLTPGVKPCGVG
mmetsp:Transcript_39059/g.112216  ORF Transcript_39059/g.112216 Transcript_39059/m.112216 type:complete len:877 (-) Transcript_39059:108-2738(-)